MKHAGSSEHNENSCWTKKLKGASQRVMYNLVPALRSCFVTHLNALVQYKPSCDLNKIHSWSEALFNPD